MPTETIANDLLEECWITTDREELSRRFDREHFEITHSLAEHPLLQIPELMELAERTTKTRPNGIYYDAGKDIRVDQRWDQMPKKQFSVVESMKRIETCGAWLLLKDVQRDPEYRAFLGGGWDEIKAKIGHNLKSQILRRSEEHTS